MLVTSPGVLKGSRGRRVPTGQTRPSLSMGPESSGTEVEGAPGLLILQSDAPATETQTWGDKTLLGGGMRGLCEAQEAGDTACTSVTLKEHVTWG